MNNRIGYLCLFAFLLSAAPCTDKPYSIPPVNLLDHKVIPTIQDKMNGVDTEIEFVKKMIGTNSPAK